MALADHLSKKGDELYVIEIAGKGSPYAFAGDFNNINLNFSWQCLFPEKRMEDVSSQEASVKLIQSLDGIMPDVVFAGAIAYPSGATAVRWARQKTPLSSLWIMPALRMFQGHLW